MPGLPQLSGIACTAVLLRAGFVIDRQNGSHAILMKDKYRVTVPQHRKDLKPGTLRSIIRQAGLTTDEFLSLL